MHLSLCLVNPPRLLASIVTSWTCRRERLVGNDSTAGYGGPSVQIPPSAIRSHSVKARVRVHDKPDGMLASAMSSIVRREDGAGWQALLGELARTSGITTPSADQARQHDRTRVLRPTVR